MELKLFIHNDIEDAAKYFKIPLAMWNEDSVYVMQEDRCVFVGKQESAYKFYKRNKGKYCKSRFPL